MITLSTRILRRAAIALAGSVVLLVGLALLVLPGPAVVVIPMGLGILAIEFAWARDLLQGVRRRVASLAGRRRSARH